MNLGEERIRELTTLIEDLNADRNRLRADVDRLQGRVN